ncbi:polymeric immunoglobulin receptor-like isoform X3 [Poecilia formosa]|uniref:polymeric immunoglobulin receptor-like isoform X3 n=1 Tax=Poecilia formosa TaxID=48698 RepID=UPI0007BAD2B8|nr:PREDICTED: polymeric immunoglobulin receptor-like isoform X3 [Poecilia formosa]
MAARLSSLCLVFLSLQVRDIRTFDVPTQYGVCGEDILISCVSFSYGAWKIFCRETCEGGNLLIRTSDDAAQIGRYRTEYVRQASKTFSVLSVGISDLTRSDAGRYRCGLGDSSSSASFQDFRLVVLDALLDGNKVPDLHRDAGSSLTVACFFEDSGWKRLFCRGGCGKDEVLVQTDAVRADRGRYSIEYDKRRNSAVVLVTITQLTQSDSGRYRCKLDRAIRSDLDRDFSITVTDDVPVIVGVTLAAMVVLVSAALLVSCRRRSLRDAENEGGPAGSNAVKSTFENPIYQDLSYVTKEENHIYCTIDKTNTILESGSEPQG